MGKERARTRADGTHYTPPRTTEITKIVRQFCIQQMRIQKFEAFKKGIALFAQITAFYPIPKSISKKKRELALSGEIRPIVKPDNDNIEKLIFDSLNSNKKIGEGLYSDDNHIVTNFTQKFYSDNPRIELEISEI